MVLFKQLLKYLMPEMLKKAQITRIKKSIVDFDSERVRMIFSALGDPGRFQIFRLLLKNSDICVTDVASILGVTVPAASQQFRILELSGLVKKNRMGQLICYQIRKEDPR